MELTDTEIINIARNIGIKFDTFDNPRVDHSSQLVSLVTVAIKINEERKNKNETSKT